MKQLINKIFIFDLFSIFFICLFFNYAKNMNEKKIENRSRHIDLSISEEEKIFYNPHLYIENNEEYKQNLIEVISHKEKKKLFLNEKESKEKIKNLFEIDIENKIYEESLKKIKKDNNIKTLFNNYPFKCNIDVAKRICQLDKVDFDFEPNLFHCYSEKKIEVYRGNTLIESYYFVFYDIKIINILLEIKNFLPKNKNINLNFKSFFKAISFYDLENLFPYPLTLEIKEIFKTYPEFFEIILNFSSKENIEQILKYLFYYCPNCNINYRLEFIIFDPSINQLFINKIKEFKFEKEEINYLLTVDLLERIEQKVYLDNLNKKYKFKDENEKGYEYFNYNHIILQAILNEIFVQNQDYIESQYNQLENFLKQLELNLNKENNIINTYNDIVKETKIKNLLIKKAKKIKEREFKVKVMIIISMFIASMSTVICFDDFDLLNYIKEYNLYLTFINKNNYLNEFLHKIIIFSIFTLCIIPVILIIENAIFGKKTKKNN